MIAVNGRADWKEDSDNHRLNFAENLMCRFKCLIPTDLSGVCATSCRGPRSSRYRRFRRAVNLDPAFEFCLVVITVGDAGDVDRIRAIVAGEIKAQRVEKVGRTVALGLLEVDLYARDEGDI